MRGSLSARISVSTNGFRISLRARTSASMTGIPHINGRSASMSSGSMQQVKEQVGCCKNWQNPCLEP